MTRITIEQQGPQWIASDGQNVCEADDPMQACLKVVNLRKQTATSEEMDREERQAWLIERLDCAIGRLQRQVAVAAPRVLIESSVRLISQAATEIVDTYDADDD